MLNIWSKLWNDESTSFISGHSSILLSRVQIVHWNFLQIAGTPTTFLWEKPILRTALDIVDEYPKGRIMHLRNEFYSYSLGEAFSLFRFLVSTWERIYGHSKHVYSKHSSMWWQKVLGSKLLETYFYLAWPVTCLSYYRGCVRYMREFWAKTFYKIYLSNSSDL